MQRLIKLMLNLRNLIEVLQDTKKNSKIHSKPSEQHKKKNPNLSMYINPNLEKNQEKTNLELATTIHEMMALPWHLFLDLGTSFSVLSIW